MALLPSVDQNGLCSSLLKWTVGPVPPGDARRAMQSHIIDLLPPLQHLILFVYPQHGDKSFINPHLARRCSMLLKVLPWVTAGAQLLVRRCCNSTSLGQHQVPYISFETLLDSNIQSDAFDAGLRPLSTAWKCQGLRICRPLHNNLCPHLH